MASLERLASTISACGLPAVRGGPPAGSSRTVCVSAGQVRRCAPAEGTAGNAAGESQPRAA
ncbi:MAG: hypothetical protein QOJ30_4245 [Pseudonocardiales bacterium]|jgi:hypothetical protein|nr:hypothetical protein [Pseudonocardiales bacterium]